MVPVELTLRNFLSYGDEETTLDFRPLRTACLSGENGHGKSALLDAITWALWGETRLGKQGHEHLIRIGADEMAVVFTFRVGGDEYRVRRQRGKRSGGQIWELQQADGNGGWRPLTGTNASDTGRIIQQLLRMSYDTFLNSAYLKQGRADEFVRQTSNKRKEILCEILELSRYDTLEDKAKQRAKIAADTAFEADRQINGIEAILAEEDRHLTAMQQVESDLADMNAERERLDAHRQKLDKYHALMEHQRERAKRAAEELTDVVAELQEISSLRASSLNNIEQAKALLADAEIIEQNYRRLLAAREQSDVLRQKVAELRRVETDRFPLLSELRDIQKDLEGEVRELEKSVAEAQRKSALAHPLRQKLSELDQERKAFIGLDQQRENLSAKISDEQMQMAALKQENVQCEAQLADLSARIERLRDQTESCSVCGSPLPQHKIAGLIAEREQEIVDVKRRQSEVKKEGARCKAQTQQLQADLKECENARNDAQRNEIDTARYEQQLRDLDEATKRLPEMNARYQEVMRLLDQKDYGSATHKTLAVLDAQYQELLPYVAEQDANSRQLAELAHADDHHRLLQKAQEKLATEQNLLTRLERSDVKARQRQKELLEEQGKLAGVEQDFRQTLADLQDVQRRQQDLARRSSEAEQYRGRLRQTLENCATQRTERAVKITERDLARKEESAYKQLAGAFGKRGVQADIIENALPELQNYANELLDRLTDGDMSVHIDTQRQSKTKGAALIETLEIQISDSLGTRALEMYSGGESFRVSFALRIALSKLLARRAGADLQTLIVDEGFGTQDAKGREKLIDAVTAIQPDFEKILVITHIDEMKDAFPSRIEVVKTASGSQISVLHGDSIG